MKFLITKELSHRSLLTNLMAGVTVALFLYLGLDVVLHAYVIGSDLESILNTLYGNVEEFIEPVLIDTLLLQVHIDFFTTLFSMMIIASIYIRLYSDKSITKWLVHMLFILGLLAPLFLLVAYFTSIPFVYAWVVSFMLGHLLCLGMSLAIIKKLLFK